MLLSPAHHHALHQRAFEIKMVDGMPWIRASVDAHDDSAWKPTSRNRLLIAAARSPRPGLTHYGSCFPPCGVASGPLVRPQRVWVSMQAATSASILACVQPIMKSA